MSEFDPSELVAVCDEIVEDGELTYNEIRDLAKYLNNNREARKNWPGNLLFKLLKSVFEDQQVSKAEAHQVGRLIMRVRKEWTSKTHTKPAKGIEVEFYPSKPRLSLIPLTVEVGSHSSDDIYQVNLAGPTCTCPDFNSYRKDRPLGHLTRCCKHILEAYAQIEPKTGYPSWMGAFIDEAWKPHPKQDWKVVEIDSSPVLFSSAPKEWSNVFALNDGNYERFGYSVTDDRWSYGISPPNSETIAAEILKFDDET